MKDLQEEDCAASDKDRASNEHVFEPRHSENRPVNWPRYSIALSKAVDEARNAEEGRLVGHRKHAPSDDHPMVAKVKSEKIDHLLFTKRKEARKNGKSDKGE